MIFILFCLHLKPSFCRGGLPMFLKNHFAGNARGNLLLALKVDIARTKFLVFSSDKVWRTHTTSYPWHFRPKEFWRRHMSTRLWKTSTSYLSPSYSLEIVYMHLNQIYNCLYGSVNTENIVHSTFARSLTLCVWFPLSWQFLQVCSALILLAGEGWEGAGEGREVLESSLSLRVASSNQ